MKSFFSFAALLSVGLCNPEWATNPPTLDPKEPIYLAHVFYPPSMRFIAYTTPRNPSDLYTVDTLDWCRNGQDVSNNLSGGARIIPFEFEGINGLKIHDYFTAMAYISRHNQRFADCFVTPQSGGIGLCPGDEGKGHKYIGHGNRVWSCWVIGNPGRKGVLSPREDAVLDKDGVTLERLLEQAEKTEAMVGSPSNTAFTAAVTGH